MDLPDFFQRELARKGWRPADLARAYGSNREGMPPESINVQRYNSTIARLLSRPGSAKFDTIRTIIRLLEYKIILTPIEIENLDVEL